MIRFVGFSFCLLVLLKLALASSSSSSESPSTSPTSPGTTVAATTAAQTTGNGNVTTNPSNMTTTTPTVSPTATAVNAEIRFQQNFSVINSSPAAKATFLSECRTGIAAAAGVAESQVTNMDAKSGSVIVSFTLNAGTVSPAAALATLKNKVQSGTLSITTTAFGTVSADQTYFQSSVPVISCFICSSTSNCGSVQTAASSKSNCTSGQNCWIKYTLTNSVYAHMRFCGNACAIADTTKKCTTDTNGVKTCQKCCASPDCNSEDLTAGAKGKSASLVLASLGLLLHAALIDSL